MNDSISIPPAASDNKEPPKWQPIDRIQRRVLGVLAEKAKTTPDQYPLTLNALRSGCNQKSNRAPLMELDEQDLYEALEKLRALGAVVEVFGSGRVPRYRHQLYEWLGVDGVQLAVMAELLLRGAQTEGELRGRAARMEPIKDLAALRPILAELKRKGLVVPLTPEGRGHVVTHALYLPNELEKIRQQYGRGSEPTPATGAQQPMAAMGDGSCRVEEAAGGGTHSASAPVIAAADAAGTDCSQLEGEVALLREQVADLRRQLETLARRVDDNEADVQRIKSDLGI